MAKFKARFAGYQFPSFFEIHDPVIFDINEESQAVFTRVEAGAKYAASFAGSNDIKILIDSCFHPFMGDLVVYDKQMWYEVEYQEGDYTSKQFKDSSAALAKIVYDSASAHMIKEGFR